MTNSYNIWNNLTWPVPDTYRVVFEENRTVFVVDVDQAGDHHEDEEAEDCNHNHLRTIRERVHKSERKMTGSPGQTRPLMCISITSS